MSRRVSRTLVLAVAGALLLTAVLLVVHARAGTSYVLYFAQTKNLHVGDAVTVLDVPVGKITAIHPESTRVRVEVSVRHDQPVPAGAHATIIAPSLVSIRHVELSPAYDGGARLPAGSVIPLARTAVPVEWDDVTKQLTALATALGPHGADKHGAASRLLTTTAANLRGEGPSLSATINALSKAMGTLSDNRGNIFASVRNLQVFVDALAASDATVHDFTTQLASLSGSLASDRRDLAKALPALSRALRDVQGFLRDNKKVTARSVSHLRQLSQSMAAHRQGLADILQSAPTAMSNYYDIYDPDVPAMTGVFVGANFESPATFICSSLYSLGQTPAQCQKTLEPIAKYFATQMPPIGVDPINREGRANSEPSPSESGSGRSSGESGSAQPGSGQSGSGLSGLGQLMLGGLLGGTP